MKPVLVCYATREGQTRRIAEHLAAALRSHDLEVDVVDVALPLPVIDFERFGAVILAASVHLGKHEPEMISFVRANRSELELLPSAFLSVSLSEAGVEDEKRTQAQRDAAAKNVQDVIDRFIADTGWTPRHIRPVAGALLYRRYNALVRLVMRLIAKHEGAPTDTSRDYEFTNWVGLDRFADDLASEITRAP